MVALQRVVDQELGEVGLGQRDRGREKSQEDERYETGPMRTDERKDAGVFTERELRRMFQAA